MKQMGASPEKKPDRAGAIAALVKLGLTDAEARNVVSAALPATVGAAGTQRMVAWRYITTYGNPDPHDDAGAGIEYDEHGVPYINPGDPTKLPSEHGAHWSEMEVLANADGSIIAPGPLIVVLPASMKPRADVVDTTAKVAISPSRAPIVDTDNIERIRLKDEEIAALRAQLAAKDASSGTGADAPPSDVTP